MTGRDEARDGFCGKTFDEWLFSLEPEELEYLERHLVVNFKFKDSSRLSISIDNEKFAHTGDDSAMSVKAYETMEGCGISIVSDEYLNLINKLEKIERAEKIERIEKAKRMADNGEL